MDKKEFKLDDEDFNRIVEISSNQDSIVQIYSGQVIKATNQQRADHFWHSISAKYGFNPDTVETNLPMKTAMYFKAVPVDYSKEVMEFYCRLCQNFTGPSIHHGCDRAQEFGCAWNILRNTKK